MVISPFYRPERAKALNAGEVLRFCPYRASVDAVMPITQGGATLCPGLWAVALSGRAFNLKGVHSTCVTCIQPAYDLKYYVL